MTAIEIVICLILLFMAVPDLCRRLGRPALAYSAYVLFGFISGPFTQGAAATMIQQAGHVGFLLLLFQVGLEIDLPRARELLKPLRFVGIWVAVQYPMALAVGFLMGMTLPEALLATAALTSCSVGMGHAAWKHYPGLGESTRAFILHVMVLLEVLAIVLLAGEAAALKSGLSWLLLAKLIGMALVIFGISRSADHLVKLFNSILRRTTHWRMHLLTLLILAICAIGERFGLQAAKTAFFLGLFLSPTTYDGMNLQRTMAPLSERFLIPIFFVGLGLQINWHAVICWQGLLAISSGLFMLGLRDMVHRRWLKTGGDSRAFLLLCPNLTIVALAANELMESGNHPEMGSQLLVTGLCITIVSVLLLPAGEVKPVEPMPADAGAPIL